MPTYGSDPDNVPSRSAAMKPMKATEQDEAMSSARTSVLWQRFQERILQSSCCDETIVNCVTTLEIEEASADE